MELCSWDNFLQICEQCHWLHSNNMLSDSERPSFYVLPSRSLFDLPISWTVTTSGLYYTWPFWFAFVSSWYAVYLDEARYNLCIASKRSLPPPFKSRWTYCEFVSLPLVTQFVWDNFGFHCRWVYWRINKLHNTNNTNSWKFVSHSTLETIVTSSVRTFIWVSELSQRKVVADKKRPLRLARDESVLRSISSVFCDPVCLSRRCF